MGSENPLGYGLSIGLCKHAFSELQTWQLQLLAAAAGKESASLPRHKLLSAGFERRDCRVPWIAKDAEVRLNMRGDRTDDIIAQFLLCFHRVQPLQDVEVTCFHTMANFMCLVASRQNCSASN